MDRAVGAQLGGKGDEAMIAYTPTPDHEDLWDIIREAEHYILYQSRPRWGHGQDKKALIDWIDKARARRKYIVHAGGKDDSPNGPA